MAKDPADTRMSFSEHLEELRSRMWRAMLAMLAGVILVWNFKEALLGWLLRPLEVAWYCRARTCETRQVFSWMVRNAEFEHLRAAAGTSAASTLHFAGPTDAFSSYMQLSIIGGMLLVLPYMFYQVWGFIAPGLYTNEKKYAFPIVASSTLFFVVGSLFGYYIVFPFGYKWFLDFSGVIPGTGTSIVPTIMMADYLEFTSMMLLAFGVVFEMPLFVFFLAMTGVVTGRQLFRFGRYFIVLAFVLAAVLTPSTDMYSQVMLGLPLVVLYYVAATLAFFFGPKEAKGFRRDLVSKKTEADLIAEKEKAAKGEKKGFFDDEDEEEELRKRILAAKVASVKAKGLGAAKRPQGYVAGRTGMYGNKAAIVAEKQRVAAKGAPSKPGYKPTAGKP